MDAPPADAAPGGGLSQCSDSAPPRALLVAISANDVIDLYALTPGHLTATGVHLTGIALPGQIVMRDDGQEALVAYGGYGMPFGVGAITVAPDGSSASVEQVLQIGTDSTPFSVAYSDHDHAVVALSAMQDEVVGIARQGGTWVAGTRVPTPAPYPLAVAHVPNSPDVLLSRSQVGVDDTSTSIACRRRPTARGRAPVRTPRCRTSRSRSRSIPPAAPSTCRPAIRRTRCLRRTCSHPGSCTRSRSAPARSPTAAWWRPRASAA
jgi:hypothetical protein